jgi:hypothetical protein
VFTVVRDVTKSTFDHNDALQAAAIARQVAAVFEKIRLEERLVAVAETLSAKPEMDGAFRQEAIDHHGSLGLRGSPLRLSTTWVGWAFWLMMMGFIMAAVTLSRAQFPQLLVFPAIVRTSADSLPVLSMIVPVRVRPHVSETTEMFFEPEGYGGARHPAQVVHISERVTTVRRATEAWDLGPVEGLAPHERVLEVRARLLTRVFQVNSFEHEYFDGMVGSVALRVERPSRFGGPLTQR